jgi:hypothetical protein
MFYYYDSHFNYFVHTVRKRYEVEEDLYDAVSIPITNYQLHNHGIGSNKSRSNTSNPLKIIILKIKKKSSITTTTWVLMSTSSAATGSSLPTSTPTVRTLISAYGSIAENVLLVLHIHQNQYTNLIVNCNNNNNNNILLL